jgi:hypothetical protein
MDEILAYYLKLKTTPQGVTLTPSHKLCLISILIDGGNASPSSLSEQLGLKDSKSIFRLLKTLQAAGLIEISPNRNNQGHKVEPSLISLIPSGIYATREQKPSGIYATKPLPSGIYATRDENPEIQSNQSITSKNGKNGEIPSGIYTTRPKSSNGNNSNSLQEKTNGTKIALIPPSCINVFKEGGEEKPSGIYTTRELLENPAVILWFELMKEELSQNAAELIFERVTGSLVCWKETLQEWRANPNWSKQNVGGQVSKYEKKLKRGEYQDEPLGTPPAPRKEKTLEEKQAEEDLINFVYGDN